MTMGNLINREIDISNIFTLVSINIRSSFFSLFQISWKIFSITSTFSNRIIESFDNFI